MPHFCGNPDCPSNWADLPCTCPVDAPLVELPAVTVGVDGDTIMVAESNGAGLVQLDEVQEYHFNLPNGLGTYPLPPVWIEHALYAPEQGGFLDRLLAEVLASPEGLVLTDEQELLVALTELVTEAQHPVGVCYIDPDDTVCHCLIGRVKAVLPLCKAKKTAYGHPAELDRLGQPPEPYWQCVLTEHPDNPERHEFREA